MSSSNERLFLLDDAQYFVCPTEEKEEVFFFFFFFLFPVSLIHLILCHIRRKKSSRVRIVGF